LVETKINNDGKIEAEIQVADNINDIENHHRESLSFLMNIDKDEKVTFKIDDETKKSDNYKSFRTWMILIFCLSNAGLWVVVTALTDPLIYIEYLMGAVLILSIFKLVGVLAYVTINFFTTIFRKSGYGKEKYVRQKDAAF
jgi:chitin synthase